MPINIPATDLAGLPLSDHYVTHLEGYNFDRGGLTLWISQQQESAYVCCQFSFELPTGFAVEIDDLGFVGNMDEAVVRRGPISGALDSDLLSRIRSTARTEGLDDAGTQIHVRFHARESA